MDNDTELYAVLDGLNITYEIHEHEPVHTVQEAEKYWKSISGAHTKNIFLRDEKGKNHFLIILKHTKSLNLKELEKKTGARKLSFASDRRLEQYLGLGKGSVSPFGLIHDKQNHVRVIIDSSLNKAQIVNFHPNVNHATVSISIEDFRKFLDFSGNQYVFAEFS